MPVYYFPTIIKTFPTKLLWPFFPILRRRGCAGGFAGGEMVVGKRIR